MDNHASFGYWVRRRRKALDLTQEALAIQINCSVTTIRKIETDERRPSRQMAELLAAALAIDPQERATFLRVARSELQVERLAAAVPALPAPPPVPPPSTPPVAPAGATPLSSPPPSKTDALPVPATPLVGRSMEVGEVTQLLQRPTCRLLTLVGVGGMGKTRLALACAAQVRPLFAEGGVFVALAPLLAPEFIVPAIAGAIGYTFAGPTDPKRQLFNYLRDKALLLVLDNFEHLLASAEGEDGALLLTELLQATAQLKLLVTSRERLHLHDEWVFDLQGLAFPPEQGAVDEAPATAFAGYSAVELFVQRARQAQRDFVLSAQNQRAVVRICQLVEGMPLGIELAATWVHLLSCQEIAQEIEHNLDFLTVSRRDLSPRQRSLRASFDHSWKLLSGDERRVLRQLAVFRGGFSRAVATAVAGASLTLLAALVAKSLIRRTTEDRYEIHELLRQYAATHLSADAQDEHATRDRHATWYLTLLAQSEADLQRSHQQAIRGPLAAELDNLRLAWRWATMQAQLGLLQQAAPSLSALYGSLHLYDEGDVVFERVVTAVQARYEVDGVIHSEQRVVLGVLLSLQAEQRFFRGRGGEARALSERSVLLLRQSDDQVALARALMYLGSINAWLGVFAEAKTSLQECITLSRALGQVRYVALSYLRLGMIAHEQGDYAEAQQWLTQALELFRQIGAPIYIPWTLMQLSRPTLALGQYVEAKQLLNEGWQLFNRLGDQMLMADIEENLGLVAYVMHDLNEAHRLWLACLRTYQTYRDPWGVARTRTHLGWVNLDRGQPVEAQHEFSDVLRIASESKNLPTALEALVGMATLQAYAGASEHALELVFHVLNHPATTQEVKVRAERLRTELEARLTPHQVEATQVRVQTQTFDALVADLLKT